MRVGNQIGGRSFRPIVAASILALSAAMLSACDSGEEAEVAAAAGDAIPAGTPTLTVTEKDIADWRDFGGEITATDMAEARTRIGGTLVRLNVTEGTSVRKGQVIGQVVDSRLGFESGAYASQAAAADAQGAAASAQLAAAEAELKRTRYLVQNGVYAPAALDQAEANARAARAQVNAAGAQASAARSQAGAVSAVANQGAILAPASGIVVRADVPAGSAVGPGTPVATITSGAIIVRIRLPESVAGVVREGSPVEVAELATTGEAPIKGAISRVYPMVQAGQFEADVALPNLNGNLIGRRLTVRVMVGQRKAVVIPRAFVISRYGLNYVRVKGPDGRAVEVPVQLGTAMGDEVEVLSGIKSGDSLLGPAKDVAKGSAK